ncbi:MAG: hypothetical protein C0501_26175 [Isosphaera sp.]|nr:hypothetical protein [Isosphaera sp.]
MAGPRPNRLSPYLGRLAAPGCDVPDPELVGRFVADRDGAALAALLRRHGPMVYNLCHRVLRNPQDAEDAYQATFLVLARKAHALTARESVGNWLYGVAYRTALKARTAAARRSRREAAAPVREPAGPLAELTVHEAQAIVDQELARLPDKFRAPLVLCCLEGLTRDEAAQQLGWPAGLLKSRLEQGRELLRGRLVRRGLTLSAGLFSTGLLGGAALAGPAPDLAAATVEAGVLVASGAAAGGVASARAVALAEGVSRALWWTNARALAAILAVAVPAALGVAAATSAPAAKPGPAARAPAPPPPPAADPDPAGKRPTLRPESLEKWGRAEVLFTARLAGAQAGPVTRSDPPTYTHKLQFRVVTVLRGPHRKGEEVTANSAVRQRQEPVFPVGKDCLMAGKVTRGQLVLVAVEEADDDTLAQAALAAALPVGWSLRDGRPVSPWEGLGKDAWPAGAAGKGPLACAATGRPALLAGDGVEFRAEVVPPREQLKFGNPDGDGEYRLTVTNTRDAPAAVPALLSDGANLLWAESLVVLCDGRVYPAPGARGVREAVRPAVLEPGEAVSTVVNVLRLDGPPWPRGGSRVEFQFALGEKSATQSFYYLSKHHDPLREKATGDVKK